MALLHDARIFISGGYNGLAVFDDLWGLELAGGAYLPQVVSLAQKTSLHVLKYSRPPSKWRNPISKSIQDYLHTV